MAEEEGQGEGGRAERGREGKEVNIFMKMTGAVLNFYTISSLPFCKRKEKQKLSADEVYPGEREWEYRNARLRAAGEEGIERSEVGMGKEQCYVQSSWNGAGQH